MYGHCAFFLIIAKKAHCKPAVLNISPKIRTQAPSQKNNLTTSEISPKVLIISPYGNSECDPNFGGDQIDIVDLFSDVLLENILFLHKVT